MNPLVAMRMKMRDRVLRFYTHDLVKISRKRRARQLLGFKTEHLTPLSAEQRDEILSFWKPFRDMTSEMKWFEFYNGLCQDKTKLKYYIPESVYYTDIDTFFTIPRRCEELDDKNMYDLFFGDVKVLEGGRPLPLDEAQTAALHAVVRQREYKVTLVLNIGQASASAFTCDLSYGYVKINAEYTT